MSIKKKKIKSRPRDGLIGSASSLQVRFPDSPKTVILSRSEGSLHFENGLNTRFFAPLRMTKPQSSEFSDSLEARPKEAVLQNTEEPEKSEQESSHVRSRLAESTATAALVESASNMASEAEKRDLKDLAEDIIAAHDTRVKIVGEIIEDTHRMMANFKTKREQMAAELQKLLAKGESLRKKDFERMMFAIIDAHAKREEEVKEMLENFRQEEEMVAEKLRGLLKKGEEVRIKDFKKMMTEIKQGQEKRIQATNESVTDQLRRMQEEVHTMLDNFKTERQSVASAWHQVLGLFRQEKSEVQLKQRSSATLEKKQEYEEKS